MGVDHKVKSPARRASNASGRMGGSKSYSRKMATVPPSSNASLPPPHQLPNPNTPRPHSHTTLDGPFQDLVPLLRRLYESKLPVSAFLNQIWQEKLVHTIEPVSPFLGSMGRFYHVGDPVLTESAHVDPDPEPAWPKDAW